MQDRERIFAKFRVTHRHQQVVLQLGENFEPRFHSHSLLHSSFALGLSTANHEDLHVFALQRLELLRDDYLNERVCQQNGVKVVQIGFQLVVEADSSQTKVDLFSGADWLFRKDDLLNFHLNLAKDFHVDRVEGLELVKEGLEFEEAEFLYGFRCIGVEDFFDNFN